MSDETVLLDTTTELVQKLLPTCQRCRRLRRKCDTQLPNCWLCQKAKVECTFFDHALQQVLPRAYVQSLLVQLDRLKQAKETTSPTSVVNLEPPSSDNPTSNDVYAAENVSHVENLDHAVFSAQFDNEDATVSKRLNLQAFDGHFPIDNAEKVTRFFGSSSVYTLAGHVLHFSISNGILAKNDFVTSQGSTIIPEQPKVKTHKAAHEPTTSLEAYVDAFIGAFGSLGIVDNIVIKQQDLTTYIMLRENGTQPSELHGLLLYQYFSISLVCSIGCAIKARHSSEHAVSSLAFYEDVLPCIEEATSEVSPQSLQALLLLTIFCLFWPGKGDLWKLLDYCCRLCVELGYHTESNDLEDQSRLNPRRSMFWGLYTVEKTISQLFGRSSDLPETTITVQYPQSVDSVDESGNMRFQSDSVSHYYRLMQDRSEIFNELYLPAVPLNLPITWYRERLATLQYWSTTRNSTAQMPDIFSTTCSLGYHNTVLMICQPLMLSALRNVSQQPQQSTTDKVNPIPQDNYHSACSIIRTYETIIQSQETSPLGNYPLTFVSAHHILSASLTLIAHATLAVAGQHESTIKFMNASADSYETEGIDFKELWALSNSALLLLSWCGERWHGLKGMLEVYKKLVDKAIPAMFRNGYM